MLNHEAKLTFQSSEITESIGAIFALKQIGVFGVCGMLAGGRVASSGGKQSVRHRGGSGGGVVVNRRAWHAGVRGGGGVVAEGWRLLVQGWGARTDGEHSLQGRHLFFEQVVLVGGCERHEGDGGRQNPGVSTLHARRDPQNLLNVSKVMLVLVIVLIDIDFLMIMIG